MFDFISAKSDTADTQTKKFIKSDADNRIEFPLAQKQGNKQITRLKYEYKF